MVAYATILISCKNKFILKNLTKNPIIITGIVAIVILRISGILFKILKISFLKTPRENDLLSYYMSYVFTTPYVNTCSDLRLFKE